MEMISRTEREIASNTTAIADAAVMLSFST